METRTGAVAFLLSDVFGAVVDWRTSIVREVGDFVALMAIDPDAAAFAETWRGLYQPSLERVRSGTEP